MTFSRTSGFALVLTSILVSACASAAPRRTAPPSDDATVQTAVRTALLNAPNVHASEIQVEAQGGVVILRGDVHGQAEEDAAIAVARSVPGVREVRSELKRGRSGP
jgi:hyperosmotically inducible protein